MHGESDKHISVNKIFGSLQTSTCEQPLIFLSWICSLSCFPPQAAALLLVVRKQRRQEEIKYDVNTAEFILTSYNIWLLLLSAHTLSARSSMITCTLQAPGCVYSPLCRSSFGLHVWVLCRDRRPSPHAWRRLCQRSLQPRLRASGRSSPGLNFHQNTKTQRDRSLLCSQASGLLILHFTVFTAHKELKWTTEWFEHRPMTTRAALHPCV